MELIKELALWFLIPAFILWFFIFCFRWLCREIAKSVISEEEVLYKETQWRPVKKPSSPKNTSMKTAEQIFIPHSKWSKYSRS
jgi:hypothetical protein